MIALRRTAPLGLWLWVAALGLLAYASHYPGQISVDAIIQLQDGLEGIYDSNQPPAVSWLIHRLGTAGFLALNLLLFGGAALLLVSRISQSVFAQAAAITFLFLFPVLFVYNGMIWKDVLFANAALLALLLLPSEDRKAHWLTLITSAIVLALAVSVRQQGLLVFGMALMYLIVACAMFKKTFGLKSLGIWVLTYVLAIGGLSYAVENSGDLSPSKALDGPIYQLALFDLGGISAAQSSLDFPSLEATTTQELPVERMPTRERMLEALSGYRADRQDYMGETIAKSGAWIPLEPLKSDWKHAITQFPADYLSHRLQFLSWLYGMRDVQLCTPYHFGISSEPAAMVRQLGIQPGISARATTLQAISGKLLMLYRPVIYLAISTVVLLLLAYRGFKQHIQMIVIQLSGLAYSASYLLVGIACDFRYTYFSTLVALFGLAYLAIHRPSSANKKAA